MTSLVSENGPSVTVILPLASRTRTPSLLGSRPPVSTSVPFLNDSSTNLPIASIKAGGGGDARYDSGWRMNVRYFMGPPWGSDHATSEPRLDRHASEGRREINVTWVSKPGRLARHHETSGAACGRKTREKETHVQAQVPGPIQKRPYWRPAQPLTRADAANVCRLQGMERPVQGRHPRHGRQAQGARARGNRVRGSGRAVRGDKRSGGRLHDRFRGKLRGRGESGRGLSGRPRPGSVPGDPRVGRRQDVSAPSHSRVPGDPASTPGLV